MPSSLKEVLFAPESLQSMADAIHAVWPVFDRHRFLREIYNRTWADLELMDRMRHVTRALRAVLPQEYSVALDILCRAAPSIHGFEALSLSEYAARYGLEHFDLSMNTLRLFTKSCSAEFAIRSFIVADPQGALRYLLSWTEDDDADVRRLSSEGCRPRLPWGMALTAFKNDPHPILPILEALRDDPSETVRRSVANNLNDISKDHPETVLDVCERWYGQSPRTDWIVRHGLRTLLKLGNRRALAIVGIDPQAEIETEGLAIEPDRVKIGERVQYSFTLLVRDAEPVRVRVELRVDYPRASGKVSCQVFKIRDTVVKPGRVTITRRFSFANQSTRTISPGTHRLTVVVNGQDRASATVDVS